MHDKAYKQSTLLLSELDKDLNRLYSQSIRKIQNGSRPLLNKMYLDDKNATQRQRLKYAKKDDNLNTLIFAFVSTMLLTNERAINKINDKTARIYILNYDYMADKVGLDIDRFGTIDKAEDLIERTRGYYDRRAYNRLVDEDRQTRQITKVLNKSIKQGYEVDHIMKEIQKVISHSRNSSITTANTESTRIINRARFEILIKAIKAGLKLKKIWRHAPHVNMPRDWHMDMDGETRNVFEPFSNGLLYPGEVSAPAKEVISCHCYLDVELIEQ